MQISTGWGHRCRPTSTDQAERELDEGAVNKACSGRFPFLLPSTQGRCAIRTIAAYRACLDLDVADNSKKRQYSKQAAGDLGTVEKTIKVHRGRMMEKMGVRNVADLVRMVQRFNP